MKFFSLFLSFCLIFSSLSPAVAAVSNAADGVAEEMGKMVQTLQQLRPFIQESGGYYQAYEDVMSKRRTPPEVSLTAIQVRALLKNESETLVSTLKRNQWRPGGEKFNQALDFGLNILATVAFMSVAGKVSQSVTGRYTKWNVRANYGRLGGLSSLSSKGGHWLSRFLLGGPWNGYGRVWLQHFVLDLTIFTLVMTPLVSAYEHLMPRLANLRYLSDMKLAFSQGEAMLLAWEQLNSPEQVEAVLLDYDGSEVEPKELNRLGWHNEAARQEHLILLYALRYLNHYLKTSKDKYCDELVLLELLNLSLPWGSEYESASGVTVAGNPGRLFYPYEREDVIKTLRQVEEMESFIRNHDIVGECRREMQQYGEFMYGDFGRCVKWKYQSKKYGGIMA